MPKTTLAINLDGGSATRAHHTQFIKRLVTFARDTGLTLELIYYLPYQSKYNPIVGPAFPKGKVLGCP